LPKHLAAGEARTLFTFYGSLIKNANFPLILMGPRVGRASKRQPEQLSIDSNWSPLTWMPVIQSSSHPSIVDSINKCIDCLAQLGRMLMTMLFRWELVKFARRIRNVNHYCLGTQPAWVINMCGHLFSDDWYFATLISGTLISHETRLPLLIS